MITMTPITADNIPNILNVFRVENSDNLLQPIDQKKTITYILFLYLAMLHDS